MFHTPRRLPVVAVAVAVVVLAVDAAARAAARAPIDLLSATVADIQSAIDAGSLTYERLVQRSLDRIEAYDRRGPQLRSIAAVNPAALADARRLDRERAASGRRGPLHGIPVAVKDNVDVAGLPTTGGNLTFANSKPARDATVVRRLRDAGAIVIAKTNMDELALGTRGASSAFGQILNPYDPTRIPGGSSGGTAVAVSAGFAVVGVATETGFSIRSPASNTALVGIAPTRGLVSRAGVLPVSFTQDRVGVHARTVADAALLLAVLRGFDAEDVSTAAGFDATVTMRIDGPPAWQMRIGVLRDLFREGDHFAPINSRLRDRIAAFGAAGVTVVDGLTTGRDLIAAMPRLRVNNFEYRFAFEAYLARLGAAAPVASFAEFVARGQYPRGGALETRFQEMLKVEALDTNVSYLETLALQRQIRSELVDVMGRARVDALVYPVKSLTAPTVGGGDDGPRDNNISATTGLPAIVVPAGLGPDGLPIALEILGRPFADDRLLEIAAAMEKAGPPRALPPATPALPGERF
jgi:amidase